MCNSYLLKSHQQSERGFYKRNNPTRLGESRGGEAGGGGTGGEWLSKWAGGAVAPGASGWGGEGEGAQDELTEHTREEHMELWVDCLLCSRQPGSQSSPGRQKAGGLRVYSLVRENRRCLVWGTVKHSWKCCIETGGSMTRGSHPEVVEDWSVWLRENRISQHTCLMSGLQIHEAKPDNWRERWTFNCGHWSLQSPTFSNGWITCSDQQRPETRESSIRSWCPRSAPPGGAQRQGRPPASGHKPGWSKFTRVETIHSVFSSHKRTA